jgi:cupin domain
MVHTVRLEDIPTVGSGEPGEPVWRPVRHHLGVHAFGINAWVAREAGDEVIEDHVEAKDSPSRHEELYFVVSGRATFTVDGEEVDAGAGTIVFVPDPESRRQAVAVEPGTTILALGGPPGEAYTVSEWERRHFPEG